MHQNIKFLIVCMHFYNLFISSKGLVGDGVRHVIPGEYPYIVSISVKTPDNDENSTVNKVRHLCTSVLVSKRDVLTAAHCLNNKAVDDIFVIVGSPDLKKCRDVGVHWWITYDQWATQNNIPLIYKHNDIAMMRIKRNASRMVELGKISALRNRHLIEHDVEIFGWGKREDNHYSMVLQTATTQVHDPIDCSQKIRKKPGFDRFTDNVFFCSYSNPYVFAHKGDSGGPILYMSEVVGITVAVCPGPDKPLTPDKVNVHIGTHFYRNFIFDVIENVPS